MNIKCYQMITINRDENSRSIHDDLYIQIKKIFVVLKIIDPPS